MGDTVQKIYAFRLLPGEDLKQSLVKFTKKNNIEAGYIITCVGSLKQANIRLAAQSETTRYNENFEIVSLIGTLSSNGVHLHIAISDKKGKTIGGHLMDGNIIYTTAELVVGEALELRFERNSDPVTGYQELSVKLKQQH